MSYGQKQTSWGRSGNQNPPLNQNIFANQLGLAANQTFSGVSPISLNALVNPAAFSSVLAQAQAAQRLIPQNIPQQQPRQAQSPPSRNQRVFVGTVTKLMETYGFVDEDVFFQTNVIRGAMPRVGDRVMVEASFNPTMPFKWNAYRIQLPQQEVPPNIVPPQGHHQSYPPRGVAPPHNTGGSTANSNRWQSERREDNQRSLVNNSSLDRPHRQVSRHSPAPSRNDVRRSPRRSPIRKSPVRKMSPIRSKPSESLKREREKSPLRESREPTRTRSPAASITASAKRDESPPRRRQRIIPRYRCYKPKQIVSSELKYLDLHKRYASLYIPSDFVRCEMSWTKSIQLDNPIQFSPHPITFHVLHKDVDFVEETNLPPEQPHDADNRYIVKVLLLSHPGISALRQKVFGLFPDGSIDEATETQPLLKNLQFLVGVKNKSEYMCIGGAWSPSLDGENPNDPQTQINTAIRTMHSLTGLDLSGCARWYKMVHLHYFRVERNRIDSVVLLLPDTSCTASLTPPSEEAFKELEEKFKTQLSQKLSLVDAEQFTSEQSFIVNDSNVALNSQPANETNKVNGVGASSQQCSTADETTTSTDKNNSEGTQVADTVVPNQNAQLSTVTAASSEENVDNNDVNPDDGQTFDNSQNSNSSRLSLTPQSIKIMKVAELREHLEARGLDSKGVKNVLLQRLQEAIEKEEACEANSSDLADSSMVTKSLSLIIKEELVEVMDVDTQKPDELGADDASAEKTTTEGGKELSEKELKALEKAKEKFEKEKKEKKAILEKHYTFPKGPSVFIYPSKTAKGGKFDCKVVSLFSLLDYRVDDNKESSFEVFLFAEAVREAYDRQNAFTVYCNLETALERETERTRRNDALNAKDKGSDSSDEIVILEDEGSGDADKKKNGKENKDRDEKKGDPRNNFKSLVHNVDAFTAFSHFDENICGYIEDRDLEEVIYSTSIDLSRNEVQKLIKKLSNRDRVNYRNITDKWVDKDGNVKYFATPACDYKRVSELANGHSASRNGRSEPALGTTPDVTDTGVVFYKGSVLNITQTVEQNGIIEKERNLAVLKNEEFDMQLKNTKKQRDQLEKTKRRLEEDLERYKKKLTETEKLLKTAQDGSAVYKEALHDCKKYAQRIAGVVDKAIPSPKKEVQKPKKPVEKINTETINNACPPQQAPPSGAPDLPPQPMQSQPPPQLPLTVSQAQQPPILPNPVMPQQLVSQPLPPQVTVLPTVPPVIDNADAETPPMH